MDRNAWLDIDAIFSAAAELEGEARASFLAERCLGRPDLQSEVESLLAADDRAQKFLEVPAAQAAAYPPARPGQVLGPFRLVELIGEGGMATVYRAERVDGAYTQQVALKIARTLLRDEESTRRFRAERQILAQLRHPHIVTLLDGGTFHEEQPYLVMELVDGTPITRDCQTRARPLDARLQLFRDVCSAVQYAHSHGVVHRDLKPANLLVTSDGVVKVLDFGVAKLLDAPGLVGGSSVGDALTRGLPVPLTPNYASPEQLRGTDVTTASDVYALGVVLYEILTDRRPYDTTGLPLDEVLEIVLDTQPPKPSAAPPQPPGGEAGGEDRAETPRPPYDRRRLRGDLDAIVRKAMRKEPEGRYASAGELADDVGRFLAGQPVLAREPSAWYTLRMLARRHRAATIVAMLAVIGVLATLGFALRERARAERSLANVRQVANRVIFDFNEQLAGVPGATLLRQRLLQDAIRYLEQLRPDADQDPALRVEIARGHRRVAQVFGTRGTDNLGDTRAAVDCLRQARALLLPLLEVSDVRVEAIGELIIVNGLLSVMSEAQRGGWRQDLLRESVAHAERLHAGHEQDLDRRRMLADAYFYLAPATKAPEALTWWTRARDLYVGVLEKRPDDQALIGNLSAVEKSVGEFMFYMHRYPEAGEAMRHALALDEQRLANAPYHARIRADVAISLNILSRLAMSQDDVAGAVALRERALAIRRQLAAADPQNVELQERLAVSLSLLAESYNQQTRHREAGAHAAEAVRLLQGLAGTTKPPLLTRRLWAASMELAIADLRQGHLSSACATHARATALVETLRRAKSVDQSYQEQVHHWAREFAPHCGNTAE